MSQSRRRPNQKLAQCKWDGCERADASHGFCDTHYMRARYSQDLEHLLPPHGRAERCWVSSCERPAYSHKLCRAHHDFVGRHDVRSIEAKNTERARSREREKRAVAINGQRLEVLKVLRGVTVEDIAVGVGYTRQWASQVIHGRVGGTDRDVARRIAEMFGVPLAWLIDPAPLTHRDLGIPSEAEEGA